MPAVISLLPAFMQAGAKEMAKIVIFFGLIASGKSTLAEAYANRVQASYFNTDRIRKELLGIEATEHRPADMGEGIYTPEITRRTYQAMLDAAVEMLQHDKSVVLDGSYASRSERELVAEYGDRTGISVRFVFCQCSDEETGKRLELRCHDPDAVSDGRWEIFTRQQEVFELPNEIDNKKLLVLNTEDTLNILVEKVVGWL